MTAINPQDHQDMEDGRALRELREALPEGWFVQVDDCAGDPHVRLRDGRGETQVSHHGDTVAIAADAARKALDAGWTVAPKQYAAAIRLEAVSRAWHLQWGHGGAWEGCPEDGCMRDRAALEAGR